jgi:hypothetical protein
MNEKIKYYLELWTIKRVLQLLFGLYFLWENYKHPNIIALIIGIIMVYQAVMNVGCFSSKGCTVPNNKDKTVYDDNQEVEYDEVD